MQTEHRHLCLYRKGNSICISFWYQEHCLLNFTPFTACKRPGAGLQRQSVQTWPLSYWVRHACSLFRRCMHVTKKNSFLPYCAVEMRSSVHTRFITGLPNIWDFTGEIKKKKSQDFDHCSTFIVSTQKDLYPVSLYLTSKINSGMHKLSSSTALHSLPVQVKIICDMNRSLLHWRWP